jgi:hypothetical protein
MEFGFTHYFRKFWTALQKSLDGGIFYPPSLNELRRCAANISDNLMKIALTKHTLEAISLCPSRCLMRSHVGLPRK